MRLLDGSGDNEAPIHVPGPLFNQAYRLLLAAERVAPPLLRWPKKKKRSAERGLGYEKVKPNLTSYFVPPLRTESCFFQKNTILCGYEVPFVRGMKCRPNCGLTHVSTCAHCTRGTGPTHVAFVVCLYIRDREFQLFSGSRI